MKHVLFLSFYIISCLQTIAQTEKIVSATIGHVTVFQSQAQLKNLLKINLPTGSTKLVIDNVANTIDPNSIQVSGTGDFTLLGVKYRQNHLNHKAFAIQDSIQKTKNDIENIDMLLAVAQNEEKMIMSNVNVKSEKDGLLPEDLKEMIDLFRQKLTEVGNRRLLLQRQKEPLTERKQRLERQLNEIRNLNLPLGEIELSLVANSNTTANLEVSYVAQSAGWYPGYDLRVKDTQSPVKIAYKANVYQNTGLDWKNVKLTLSTSNPSISGQKPELYPQFLSFWVPRPVMQKMESRSVSEAAVMTMATAEDANATAPEMGNIASTVVVDNSQLSVSFDIPTPYSIPTGGQPETVEIQNLTANAVYKSIITPKLDPNAFLVAELAEWEKLNLLSGEANVYFENKFIGKTYVSGQVSDQKMLISLGKDTRIVAKREEIENYKARKTIGSNIRESFGYKISIKNQKNISTLIILEDQVPISQDSDIEVDIEDLQGATLDPQTGKLKWEFELAGGQNKEISLKYTVKYPKNKTVNNL
jgi:uncharacterized protein (TIGR02231 family)